jgi:hypothetical protein
MDDVTRRDAVAVVAAGVAGAVVLIGEGSAAAQKEKAARALRGDRYGP